MSTKGFSLKIEDPSGAVTFLYRLDGRSEINYVTGSETPLSLSNLVSDQAAELRIKLSRAYSETRALTLVQDTLQRIWVKSNLRRAVPRISVIR